MKFTTQKTLLLFLITCTFLSCGTKDISTAEKQFPAHAELDFQKTLTKIAFGSCSHEYDPQPIWKDIVNQKPDLWIWLGDNIYGDSEDMDVLRGKYNLQLSNTDYQALYKSIPLIGIWDDHDYGLNDGGKEYPMRDESKKLMFEFLGVAADHPDRKHNGAYQSYTFGENGKKVKVILLDSRYFRDKPVRSGNAYAPNLTGTILGEAQWKWLAKELDDPQIDLFLIGNGIQVIPIEHRFEKWNNFPNERKRLLDLIVEKQPKGVVLLSGDRHIAEVSQIELPGLPYPLTEITSSGLTHTYEEASAEKEPNQFRKSPLINKKHFGVLNFDWSSDKVSVSGEIRGLNNRVLHSFVIGF